MFYRMLAYRGSHGVLLCLEVTACSKPRRRGNAKPYRHTPYRMISEGPAISITKAKAIVRMEVYGI